MAHIAVTHQAPVSADMSVGDILRTTRTHYGQSLSDIERALRIRSSQIEAIEKGDVESLPGRVYAIGFVRTYSEYLGLDAEQMVDLFKAQEGERTVDPALHFPVGASDSKLPSLKLLALSVLLAAGIGAVAWGLQTDKGRDFVINIPDAPEIARQFSSAPVIQDKVALEGESVEGASAIDSSDLTEQVVIAPEAATDIAAPEDTLAETEPAQIQGPQIETVQTPVPVPENIILTVIENSWIEIKGEGDKTLVSKVLKAGDRYFVPDRPDLKISLGNAGGVQIKIGDKTLGVLGELGQVRRDIPLDVAYLKRYYEGRSSPTE